jgi:hypothetical protein
LRQPEDLRVGQGVVGELGQGEPAAYEAGRGDEGKAELRVVVVTGTTFARGWGSGGSWNSWSATASTS